MEIRFFLYSEFFEFLYEGGKKFSQEFSISRLFDRFLPAEDLFVLTVNFAYDLWRELGSPLGEEMGHLEILVSRSPGGFYESFEKREIERI